MSGELIEQVNLYSTIGANFTTIITGLVALFLGVPAFLYFFRSKRFKAVLISSKTFLKALEKEDVIKAIYPNKIYDETIDISYDKAITSPIDFCNQNKAILSEIKTKYNPICIFGISEMFIFFWIGYFLQDSVHIRGFRKLKEGSINFYGNPWSWTGFLSLKWILSIKGMIKSICNPYKKLQINSQQGSEINLIINISYKIDTNSLPDRNKLLQTYIFGISKPEPSFLINEGQVFKFSKNIKAIMHTLDEQLGSSGIINIYGTLPVPFCIKLGQSIHRNGPECVFYDKDNTTGKYIKIISTKDFII